MTSRKDVIVLGAGISGLSCAKLLREQYGLDVLVLEARDRVGGRTPTLRDPSYQYTDLGGAYVGPTQRRVARMSTELGLEFYKVNVEEKSIWDMEGTRFIYYGIVPPIFNPILGLDLNHAQRLTDRLAKQVPIEAPWEAEKAAEWDKMTYQQFIDQTCWTRFAKAAMALVCETAMVAEPCEVSFLYFLWYIASGQGVQRMVNVQDGAQERKFVGGSMQLSERMAARLGPDVVKLSHPVRELVQGQGPDAAVKVICATGEQYEASYVVSSVPLTTLSNIKFQPSLPKLKAELVQRLPMGHTIKCMMFYNKPFWREKGFCGQMACDRGPVRFCMDDTKPDGSCACIMGFVRASATRDLHACSTDQRKQIIAAHYADIFQCDEFLKPINYVEMNWAAEEYSSGCLSYMPPGLMTSVGKVIREPFDKVYFAGTETAVRWAGYMDGAIEAGERAAREVLHTMGKIPASEIWREEAPSPDFPERDFPGQTLERILPTVSGLLWTLGAAVAMGAAWLAQRYVNFSLTLEWAL